MNFKILIIEDEPLAASKLKRHLRKIDESIEIVAVTESIVDSITALKAQQPDLILSDIQLSDGMSFEVFRRLQIDIPVIFVTAYDEYAIQAFKTNSIDYLLKPVSLTDLKAALDKFMRIHAKTPTPSKTNFEQLIEAMRAADNYKERFLVQSAGGKLRSLNIGEIAYCFSEDKYTFIVSVDGHKYISDHNLSTLEGLVDPKSFFRINRKYLISINAIESMVQFSRSRVKLELSPPAPDDVIVSVERSPEFKSWLGK